VSLYELQTISELPGSVQTSWQWVA